MNAALPGQSPPSETYNASGQGLPFLQGKAEFGPQTPTPVKWCSSPVKVAPQGATLISVRAPVGDVNHADQRYCIGRGLAAIVAGPELDEHYLYYWLAGQKSYLNRLGSGSIFKSISGSVLQDLQIPLPALDEQRRIARILSTIQASLSATDRLLSNARALRTAFIRDAFNAGQIPLAALPSVARVRTSFPTRQNLTTCTTDNPSHVLFLKVSDLSRSPGPVVTSPAEVVKSARCLERGATVFPKRGGAIGTNVKRILGRQAVLDPNLIGVEPGPLLLPRFPLGFFESIDLRSLQDNTPIPQLNKHNVDALHIPVPTLREQSAVCRALDALDSHASATLAYRAWQERTFKAALQSLLGGDQ